MTAKAKTKAKKTAKGRKGAKHIDWPKLRQMFLSREAKTLGDLADKSGESYRTIRDRAAKEGWTDLRQKTDQRAVEKTIEKTAEKVAETIAEARARQVQTGQMLQSMGITGLDEMEGSLPPHLSIAAISAGAKMEQAGMGIGAEGGNSTPAPLREENLSPAQKRAEMKRLEKIVAGANKRKRSNKAKKK